MLSGPSIEALYVGAHCMCILQDEDFEMALDLLRMSPVALPLLIMPSVSNPMMAYRLLPIRWPLDGKNYMNWRIGLLLQ